MSALINGEAWEACGQYVRERITAEHPGGLLVAEVCVQNGRAIERARLISAAPELLEAGAEAGGAISACMEMLTRLGRPSTAQAMKAHHDKLLAAIVKATGGAA